MLHDQQVECCRIGEGAPHHQRVGDRPVSIGECHCASLGENTEFRQLAALKAASNRAIGVYLDDIGLARAPGDELDHRDIVDRWIGVGQAYHRGDATGSGGRAGRLEAFLVLAARLRQMHAHVYEPRGQAIAAAIDNTHVVRRAFGKQARAGFEYLVALDQYRATLVEPARRVQQARVYIGCSLSSYHAHCAFSPVFRDRLRVTRSRHAMRTATPISTCS